MRPQAGRPARGQPRLYIAGQQVWDAKMGKGDSLHPNASRSFSNSVLVELREQNNNKSEKSLGKWTIDDTPTASNNPRPLTRDCLRLRLSGFYDVV